MSASANILTKPELFDLYVRKFRSICDTHGVEFGSLQNLHDLVPRLTEDTHFATDFWTFIGKISRREEGELSDEQLLAIIVESIASGDIANSDGELKTLVDELSALLGGIHIGSLSPGSAQPGSSPSINSDSQGRATQAGRPINGEMHSRISSPRLSFISEAIDPEARPVSSSPSTLSFSPRVVFISEGIDREADPPRSLLSRLSSSPRAVFLSEGADGEAAPTPFLPSRLTLSPRAAFLSEHADGGVPAQLSSSTLPYTRRSADELPDAETRPPRSLLSTLTSSLRAAFLAQDVDSETQAHGSSSSASPPPSRAAFISEALDGNVRAASSSSAPPRFPDIVRSPQPTVGEVPAASSLPSTLSSELVEGLRWLQASSLELKQHLDEIDKKMSRLEPHLDELTARDASPAQRVHEVVEDAPTPTVGQFTRELVAKLKFVLQPYLSPGSESLATDAAGPSAAKAKKEEWIPIPLGAYAQPRGPHGVLLCAFLVLLVAGSVFLLQRYDLVPQDGAWRETYTALVQKMQGPVTRPAEATSANDGIIAGTETAVAAVASVVDEVANPPASPDKPSPSSRAFSGLQAAAVNFNPLAAGNPSRSHSARAENPTPAAMTATPDYASSNDREAPVSVAAPVMEANLVLSRVPAYPRGARADRVEGPVVMKAIISTSGTVQDVRVIEGDPRLRSAAADAIYKRRYRPYLLHGHPVEVATTITVDFKLNRSR